MATTNIFGGTYVGLLSALSSNGVPTELSGNGYARALFVGNYDPVQSFVVFPEAVTFGPGVTATWAAAVFVGVFDAATSGNLILSWPIPSVAVAVGATYTIPSNLSVNVTQGLLAGASPVAIGSGKVFGTLSTGQTVSSGVATQFSAAGVLAAGSIVATVPLIDAASIVTNGAAGGVFSVTLAGNRTLAAPTNMQIGQTYRWYFTQDGTGTRTLALNAIFKTEGGAPTLSTAAGAVDRYDGVFDGTTVWGRLGKAYA